MTEFTRSGETRLEIMQGNSEPRDLFYSDLFLNYPIGGPRNGTWYVQLQPTQVRDESVSTS